MHQMKHMKKNERMKEIKNDDIDTIRSSLCLGYLCLSPIVEIIC